MTRYLFFISVIVELQVAEGVSPFTFVIVDKETCVPIFIFSFAFKRFITHFGSPFFQECGHFMYALLLKDVSDHLWECGFPVCAFATFAWTDINLESVPTTWHRIDALSFLCRNTRTCIHTPGSPALIPQELTSASVNSLLNEANLVYFDGRLADTAIVLAEEVREHLWCVNYYRMQFLYNDLCGDSSFCFTHMPDFRVALQRSLVFVHV